MTRWTAALVFSALVAVATPASAQRAGNAQPLDHVRFDLHVDFAWYGAFGAGFRVDIPIVPNGFLHPGTINDDFVLSVGGDLFFWNSLHYNYRCGAATCTSDAFGGVFGAFEVAAQWNLYVGNWSFFPEAGVAFVFGNAYYWQDRYYNSFVWPFVGGGGRWHFSASNSLLLRVTWPAGLQFGITF